MRNAGALLMVIGGVLVFFAFTMDTSVYSSGTYIGGSYVGGGSTHNLGLLQQQMMVLHTGLAAFIAGAIMYAIGSSTVAPEETTRKASWDALREGETDEEREDRIHAVRRFHRVAGAVVLLLLLAVVGCAIYVGNMESPNVDANMMDIDVNMDANLDLNMADDNIE